MGACVYCHKSKGKRSCPALGDLICPSCCGQHRVARISCPDHCSYLTTHEGYQRGRTAQTFAMERARILQGIRDQKAQAFIQVLEAVLYRHYSTRGSALDAEVLSGIEEIRRRLSPLTFPGSPKTGVIEGLWKDLEPFAKELDQQTATQAMDEYIGLARSFSGEGLRSHTFLRGLFGFLEQYQPELVKRIHQETPSGKIIPV